MARRKKGAVRKGKGAHCNICGLNCGKGGGLSRHVEQVHKVKYRAYTTCFKGTGTVLLDKWTDSGGRMHKTPVLIHVLVRRVVTDPGERGVAQ